MKTIVSIDITGAPAETGMRLAAFCGEHGLTFTLGTGEATRTLTLADAAHIKAPAASPAPVARPKRGRKPKASATPSAPKAPRAKAPRDRSIVVTAEEKARVLGLVKKHDTGSGVRTEVLYAGMPGTRSHKQAILLTLRRDKVLADNGLPRRSLAVFLPRGAAPAEKPETVEHKGQTLVNVKPGVVKRRTVVVEPTGPAAE